MSAVAPHFIGSEKAPDAFRTISEVSAELDVPQHVLRFWEQRFAQVKPIKRGGNRRYYRPDDVDLLRGIRTLLYADGFTIKGVQKLIREQGVRYVAGLGRADCSLIKSLSRHLEAPQPRDSGGPAAKHVVLAAIVHEAQEPVCDDGEARLSETARVRLEILLAELLQLKSRLHTAPFMLAAE